MEQFFKENQLMVIAFALFLGWFILTCINNYCKKKWLYIAELTILLVNIICDVCLAFLPKITIETLSISMQLIVMAMACVALAIFVLQDFYKNCHGR